MRAGDRGLFGPAIYFADSESAARHKSQHGSDQIFEVRVNMGFALQLETPDTSMTANRLQQHGYDSIIGRSRPEAAWEYVVFDPSLINLTFPKFISDIAITCRSDRDSAISAIPYGYTRHTQDLCQGTKRTGDYVYLSYKTSNDPQRAITDIALEWFDSNVSSSEYYENGRTYRRILSDLNSGARGKYIYLSYTRDSGPRRIKEIDSDVRSSDGPSTPSGWEYVCWRDSYRPADANFGAGGPYIFLRFRRE
jgi:hypothetical protein